MLQSLTQYVVTTAPAHGSAAWSELIGAFVYVPEENYNGGDSFQYVVIDDDSEGPDHFLESDPATVSITVNPVNDAPVVVDDTATTDEDVAVTIDVLGNDFDIDSPTITVIGAGGWAFDGQPANGGTVTFSGTSITYTPYEDWYGVEDLWYSISDGEHEVFGYVTVTVAPVNDDPVVDENWWGPADSDFNRIWEVGLLATDVDLDEWFIVSVGSATAGTVSFSGQTFTYEYTDFTFDGYDSFEVTISDGNGGTDTGTVVIECWGDGEALKASGTSPGVAAALPSDRLPAIVAEARARWGATGVDTSVLDSAEFRMADLSGTQLARVVSSVVLIDSNAAGFGWFVDSTPADDREFRQVSSTEFRARRSAAADGQMDLLTAIMHEMGHLLELQHTESGLMASTLAAGVRKLPVDSAWMAMTVDEFYSSDEELEDAFLPAD